MVLSTLVGALPVRRNPMNDPGIGALTVRMNDPGIKALRSQLHLFPPT